MTILDCSFNTVALQCDCGDTSHVRYHDLPRYVCPCGNRLGERYTKPGLPNHTHYKAVSCTVLAVAHV